MKKFAIVNIFGENVMKIFEKNLGNFYVIFQILKYIRFSSVVR